MAWQAGGYFPSSHLRAGAVALAATGALLLLGPAPRAPTARGLAALAALAALALWSGLSASWSPAPVVAAEDFQRTLVYVGLFGLGLLAAESRRVARVLPWAVLALVVAVAAYALAGRLLPDVLAPGRGGELNGFRLAQPLAYWNALGALAAVGVVLALGLAADRAARTTPRALAAGAAVLLALAGYLSLSRGAWIALAAGVLVLLAAAPSRRSALLSAAIVAACAGVAATALEAFPALTDDPAAGRGQLAAGHAYLPTVLVAVAAAAGAQALAAGGQRAAALAAVPRGLRSAALAAVVVAGLLGAAGYAAEGDRLERRAAGQVVHAEGFVDRQWSEFWHPQTFSASGTERLTSARGTRGALYAVAWDGWRAAPLRGEGAGAFEVRWMRDRDVEEKVRDAHSLYLETLAELGLVGLLLVGAFLAAVATGAVALCRRDAVLGRGRAAAVTAAVAAWAVHAGVDWDWQVPALTGVALLLAATLCTPRRGRPG